MSDDIFILFSLDRQKVDLNEEFLYMSTHVKTSTMGVSPKESIHEKCIDNHSE